MCHIIVKISEHCRTKEFIYAAIPECISHYLLLLSIDYSLYFYIMTLGYHLLRMQVHASHAISKCINSAARKRSLAPPFRTLENLFPAKNY